MTTTPREIPRAMGGAVTLPFSWCRSFHLFSASALLDGSFDGVLNEGFELDKILKRNTGVVNQPPRRMESGEGSRELRQGLGMV